VKSDFFRIVIEYSKSNGNIVAFYIEPITACLFDVVEDDEFNVDNFMTYHLSMLIAIPGQSSPLSNLIEQDTPLTSNLSELTKNVRSRQLQRINVGDSKNIPQQTSFDDEGVHTELGTAVTNSSKIAPVNCDDNRGDFVYHLVPWAFNTLGMVLCVCATYLLVIKNLKGSHDSLGI
jgi:hypothetical protein